MTEAREKSRRLELAQLRRLKLASLAEAITLVLLICIAMPLKHLEGHANAVHIMGPIHGVVFLAYVWIALQTVAGGDWSGPEIMRLIIGACVPFGGFLNMPFLARKAALLR